MNNRGFYQKCFEMVYAGYRLYAVKLIKSAVKYETSQEDLCSVGINMWGIKEYECAEIAYLGALDIGENPAVLFNYSITLDDSNRILEALTVIKRYAQMEIPKSELDDALNMLRSNHKQHLIDEILNYQTMNVEGNPQENQKSPAVIDKDYAEYIEQLTQARLKYWRGARNLYIQEEAVELADKGFLFTINQILELGNPKGRGVFSIAEIMVQYGYVFSMDDLLKLKALGNSHVMGSVTCGMVARGYGFIFEEIMKLDNPANSSETLAHAVANFTFDELLQLGNTQVDHMGRTIAHRMAMRGHVFSVEEILKLGNPPEMYGSTIAHFMVENGHTFTVNEIIRLGEPKDRPGRTVAYLMAEKGYQFSIDEILLLGNPVNYMGISLASRMAERGYQFSLEDILKLGNPVDHSGVTLAHIVAKFSFDQLMQIGNLSDNYGNTIAHRMAEKGHKFSVEELIKLGNPANNNKNTIAHNMIGKGYKFSFEDLQKLGNPSNKTGMTLAECMAEKGHKFKFEELLALQNSSEDGYRIALLMAKKGYKFTVDEIIRLGFPPGITIAHVMANKKHLFNVDELLQMGNPEDLDGMTVAHTMVQKGYCFSVEEILKLGNPKNKKGISVAMLMAKKGHRFTEDEGKIVGIRYSN